MPYIGGRSNTRARLWGTSKRETKMRKRSFGPVAPSPTSRRWLCSFYIPKLHVSMQTEARVGVVVDNRAGAVTMARCQKQQRHIGTAAHLATGGVAGTVSKTCTALLAGLTILFQVAGMHSDVATLKNYIVWHEASRIVRVEGFGAFWKGNLVTIVHQLPYSAISFYSYKRYKMFLRMVPGLDDPNYISVLRLLCGGFAGVTAICNLPIGCCPNSFGNTAKQPESRGRQGCGARGGRWQSRGRRRGGEAVEEAGDEGGHGGGHGLAGGGAVEGRGWGEERGAAAVDVHDDL